jgi:hypothetical protein
MINIELHLYNLIFYEIIKNAGYYILETGLNQSFFAFIVVFYFNNKKRKLSFDSFFQCNKFWLQFVLAF